MFLKRAYASRRSEKVPNQVCWIPNGLSEGLRVTMLTKSGFINSRDTMTSTISFVRNSEVPPYSPPQPPNPHSQKLRAIKFENLSRIPTSREILHASPMHVFIETSYLHFLFDCVDDNERRFREEAAWKSCWLYVTVHNCSSNRIVFKSCLKAQTCLIAVNVIRVSVSQSNGDPIFGVSLT